MLIFNLYFNETRMICGKEGNSCSIGELQQNDKVRSLKIDSSFTFPSLDINITGAGATFMNGITFEVVDRITDKDTLVIVASEREGMRKTDN